jgi:hypothetical protein
MQVQQLSDGNERSFLLVLGPGEEVVKELVKFARDQRLLSGRFTGLGALSDVVLGFFDLRQKDFKQNPLSEQVEIVSLVAISRVREMRPRFILTSWSREATAERSEVICCQGTCVRPWKSRWSRPRLWLSAKSIRRRVLPSLEARCRTRGVSVANDGRLLRVIFPKAVTDPNPRC